jgi:hypothetical protein
MVASLIQPASQPQAERDVIARVCMSHAYLLSRYQGKWSSEPSSIQRISLFQLQLSAEKMANLRLRGELEDSKSLPQAVAGPGRPWADSGSESESDYKIRLGVVQDPSRHDDTTGSNEVTQPGRLNFKLKAEAGPTAATPLAVSMLHPATVSASACQ